MTRQGWQRLSMCASLFQIDALVGDHGCGGFRELSGGFRELSGGFRELSHEMSEIRANVMMMMIKMIPRGERP